MTLRIKPHHFVDIVARIGAGERTFSPHRYGHLFHLAARRILDDPETFIELELGSDDICDPCVHNKAGICDDLIDLSYRPDAPPLKQDWNLLLDRRWCSCLQLQEGVRLTGTEFCRRLLEVGREAIQSIYLEIPPTMTARKGRSLRAGAKFLLSS